MPRKGRLLELIVKDLEESLSPKGISVKSPEEFHDQNGIKIGEIDVTLRGKFGSTSIFIGLECRDRPQKGKQGVDWITQLKGKQTLFGADKMIAVSSTGFTMQAIKAASDLGIELRNLENADENDLRTWFDTLELTVSTGSHLDKTFELAGIIGLQIDSDTTSTIELDGSTAFIKGDSGELIALHRYMENSMDLLFTILKANPNIVEMMTTLEYKSVNIVLNKIDFKVKVMSVPVKIWQEVVKGYFLLSCYKDLQQENVIALSGICEIKPSRHPLRKVLVTAKIILGEEECFDLTCSFLNQNNIPVQVDGGMYLYGWPNI